MLIGIDSNLSKRENKMNSAEWAQEFFPQGGFYIEAGAHDGIGDSTTYALEQIGWKGICVEPSAAFELLKRSRKCKVDNRCLWCEDGVEVPFQQLPADPELSGINTCFGDHWDRDGRPHVVIKKKAVTLTTLLKEHQSPNMIQLLSLDTEGSEYEILRVHDFEKYRLLLVTIEHNRVEAKKKKLRELMLGKGYRIEERNTWDIEDWFIHESVTLPSSSG